MRIVIAAVGRLKSGPLAEVCEEYRKRIPWPVEIREIEERRPSGAAERRRREAKLLQAALPDKSFIVALDERGRNYDSMAFAGQLAAWNERRPTIVFAIGGADGLDPDLVEGADARLALGAMTWPHFLVRVMLLEQIYRGAMVARGHPYHRGC